MIDRLFFRPIDPVRLGVCRILATLVALYWVIGGGMLYGVPRDLTAFPRELHQPLSFTWPFFLLSGGAPHDLALDIVRDVLVVGLVLVLVGWKTRLMTFLTAPLTLAYLGLNNSFGIIYSLNVPLYLVLLLGCFADWGAALSLDARGAPPVAPNPYHGMITRLMQALTALVFFLAGFHKMTEAPMWLSGGALWRYLVEINATTDAHPALRLWLIAHPGILRFFELSTLAFECSFPLAFFVPRLGPLYVLGAIGFHIGNRLTFPNVEGFCYLPLYATFLPLERLLRPSGGKTEVATPTAGVRSFGRLLVGSFLGLEIVAGLVGQRQGGLWQRALWPFNEMAMFSWTVRPDAGERPRLVVTRAGKRVAVDPHVFHPTVGSRMWVLSQFFRRIAPDERVDRGLAVGVARFVCTRLPEWTHENVIARDVVLTYEAWRWPYEALLRGSPLPEPSIEVLRTIPLPERCP